ncbi:FCD domain-containing protein [Nocardia sp. NPDC050193]
MYEDLAELDVELGYATELRDLVEPRIAELAALRAVESNPISLDGVLVRSRETLAPEESMRLDIEFHTLPAHAAQNPLRVTLCTMTTEWTQRTRALSHRTALGRRISVQGHELIYRAVAGRDGTAFARGPRDQRTGRPICPRARRTGSVAWPGGGADEETDR